MTREELYDRIQTNATDLALIALLAAVAIYVPKWEPVAAISFGVVLSNMGSRRAARGAVERYARSVAPPRYVPASPTGFTNQPAELVGVDADEWRATEAARKGKR